MVNLGGQLDYICNQLEPKMLNKSIRVFLIGSFELGITTLILGPT